MPASTVSDGLVVLGAIAIGYPDEPSGPRDPVPTDGLLVIK